MIPIVLLTHSKQLSPPLMLPDQHLGPVIVLDEFDDLGLQLLLNAGLLPLNRLEFQADDRVRLLKL